MYVNTFMSMNNTGPGWEDEANNDDIQAFTWHITMKRVAAITTTHSEDGNKPVTLPDTPSERKDIVIDSPREVAATDASYLALIAAIESGFSTRRELTAPSVRQNWVIWHELSVDDRLVLFEKCIVNNAPVVTSSRNFPPPIGRSSE